MDLETVLLIGAALVGIVVGVLHLVGYVPPRYRRMLSDVQASTATAIAGALDDRLGKIFPEGQDDSPDPLIELRDGLASLQQAITQVAPQVGEEVKKAIAEGQREFAAEMAKEVPAQLAEVAQGIPPEVTGAMGGIVSSDRKKQAELNDAIGRGLLGPYGAILEQVFPPLYDYLVANPDQVVAALKMPIVQELIQKGSVLASRLTGAVRSGGSDNPFLGGLSP